MTSSVADRRRQERRRNSGPFPRMALLVVLTTALAAPALSQSAPSTPEERLSQPPPTLPNAPMRLVPLGPPGQTAPGTTAEATPAPRPARSAPAGIEVQSLGRLSTDAGGLGGADSLGPDLWRNSSRGVVEGLISLLPIRSQSAVARDLARRVLSTSGTLPSGEGGKRNFAAIRLEHLAQLGDAAASAALAEAAPVALEDESAAKAWIETQLLAGDGEAGCRKVPELIGRFPHPLWQKYQIICQVQASQAGAVGLGIDLLREQGEKDDTFFRLAEAAAGGLKQPVKGITEPSPEQLALIRASKRGLPADVKAPTAAGQAAVALTADTPVATRLAAAERAAALGTLSGRDLAQIYRLLPVPKDEIQNAASAVGKKTGIPARALLAQALIATPSPAAKAELLHLAVERADTPLLAGAYGAMLAAEAGQLSPGAGFGFVSPSIARLLLLQNRPDLARPWVELARREDGFDRLWPLAALHGLVRSSEIDLASWLNRMKSDDDAERRGRAGAVLTLLVAGGEPVDAVQRLRTLNGTLNGTGRTASQPDTTLWYRLEEAARDGRRGETVLIALILLGESSTPNPLTVAHVMVCLTAAGLGSDARWLGAETAAALLPP
jgi:hypothetical protein